MTYEEMRAMEETHACAQCGMPLVTIWDQAKSENRLVCGTDRSHQGFQRILAPSQALARGTLGEKLSDKSQEDLEKLAKEGKPNLTRLPSTDLATNKPLFHAQVTALVIWGEQLGLKPYLGHVCLYYGKPYVSVDGYYYLLHKKAPALTIGTRPLSEEERKAMFIPEGDHAWVAQAYSANLPLPLTGLGIVSKDEIEGKSKRDPGEFRAPVVHGHPQRMAEKRAEWQLLRKLLPLEETE